MSKRNLLISCVLSAFLFTGCVGKAMMPYEEDFTCPKTNEGGMCGSVTKIYESGFRNPNDDNKIVLSKPIGMTEAEKKTLSEATTSDEEQTALIAALWRMNKELSTKVSKIEQAIASSELNSKMAIGTISSVSRKVDSLSEKFSQIEAEFKPTVHDVKSDTNTTTSYVVTPYRCGLSESVSDTNNTVKPVVVQKNISTQKTCKVEGKTKEPCEVGKCYSSSNLNVREDINATSKVAKVVKRCSIFEVAEIKGDRAKVENGWVALKYLKKIKDNNVTDKNKTIKGESNASAKK